MKNADTTTLPGRQLSHCSRFILVGMPLLLVLAVGCATKKSDKSVIGSAEQFQTGLNPAEVADPEVNRYLAAIGQRIVAVGAELDRRHIGSANHFDAKADESWMFKDIQFHLVNSKTLNAFTTGGKHVYIYNALLQLCQNENQLAAVMSHEYGHIYSRHVQKSGEHQFEPLLAAVAGAGAGYLVGGKERGLELAQAGAGLGMQAGQIYGMQFSRTDEEEADKYGFEFYFRAGWDPQQFGDFFQTLVQQGGDKTPEFLSDHPSLAKRVEIAKKRAAALPASAKQYQRSPIKSDAEFIQLRKHAVTAATLVRSDESLKKTETLLQALPRSCLFEDNPNPASAVEAQTKLQEMFGKQTSEPAEPSEAKPQKKRTDDR